MPHLSLSELEDVFPTEEVNIPALSRTNRGQGRGTPASILIIQVLDLD